MLTPREVQVLQLAARAYSAAEIAEALFLSPATVKRHFEGAYARLGVSDRAAAVAEAMRQGLDQLNTRTDRPSCDALRNVVAYSAMLPRVSAAVRRSSPVQRLFELSVDMLGTASADGYFTRLNPAWSRRLGWSLDELMAEPFLSFVHPDDVAATLEVATRIPEPGAPASIAFENRYRTRDGDYRLIDWTGVAEHGVLYFVAKDVTDRRATEIEHAQAASLARAITDSVTDGLLVTDQDGAIVYVNPSGLAMLGYEADELIGRDCRETRRRTASVFRRKDGSALPVVCLVVSRAARVGRGQRRHLPRHHRAAGGRGRRPPLRRAAPDPDRQPARTRPCSCSITTCGS